MEALRVLSAADQVANHLRAQLCRGVWGGRMPGGSCLAKELGVGRDTVEAALQILEHEELLIPQGAGRRRRIELPNDTAARQLRLAILDYEPPAVALEESYVTDMIHRLGKAGHSVFFAEKSLLELRFDPGRVARLVRRTKADAWLVGSASREVLAWFASQQQPAYAIFGRREGLPIAGVGPDKASAIVSATRRLISLGHRKISLLCRQQRRLPHPGLSEQAFLNELAAQGITTGTFNLPDWEETKNGFVALLDSLFAVTPPTALILDEAFLYNAAFHYLAKRDLRVPEDISLICTDYDQRFSWCVPSVAHIHWDHRPVVQRVLRWADDVSRGKNDKRQILTKAEFVEGGTIGPVSLSGRKR